MGTPASMPSTQPILAKIRSRWAMPVFFEELAASLDAWQAIKPTMTGMSVCNFKKRTEPLSTELLDLIGDYLFEDELVYQKERWMLIISCGRQECGESESDSDDGADENRPRWPELRRPEIRQLFQDWWYEEDGKHIVAELRISAMMKALNRAMSSKTFGRKQIEFLGLGKSVVSTRAWGNLR